MRGASPNGFSRHRTPAASRRSKPTLNAQSPTTKTAAATAALQTPAVAPPAQSHGVWGSPPHTAAAAAPAQRPALSGRPLPGAFWKGFQKPPRKVTSQKGVSGEFTLSFHHGVNYGRHEPQRAASGGYKVLCVSALRADMPSRRPGAGVLHVTVTPSSSPSVTSLA